MASGIVKTGTKLVPLWTNSSPTSSFAAQSVSVDLSPYDWFAIEYRYSATSLSFMPLAMFEVDENPHLLSVANDTSNRTGGRGFTYSIANQAIAFGGASYNGSATNNSTVPIAIYGIKL